MPSRKVPPPPHWTPPSALYALVGAPRSGSSYFCELLAKTGRLGVPREYFNPRHNPPPAGTADDISWRCRDLVERGTTGNGVTGFKLFPYQFRWLERRINLSHWFPSIRWIHILRRDKLGQAISGAIASRSDNYWGICADAVPAPEFSARLVSEWLTDILTDEMSWAAYFIRNGIEPLTLFYEDIEADPAAKIRMAAAFMGVTLEAEPDLATLSVKQRSALNGEWRQRYLEETGSLDWLDAPLVVRPYARTTRNFLRFLRGKLVRARLSTGDLHLDRLERPIAR